MLQGASEEHIMGRTPISYRLLGFKSGVVSVADAKSSGHSSKSRTHENVE
jgi:hypothetical protein